MLAAKSQQMLLAANYTQGMCESQAQEYSVSRNVIYEDIIQFHTKTIQFLQRNGILKAKYCLKFTKFAYQISG